MILADNIDVFTNVYYSTLLHCSNKSETLPIEASMNITCLALSPDGYTFIAVNEGIVINNLSVSYNF